MNLMRSLMDVPVYDLNFLTSAQDNKSSHKFLIGMIKSKYILYHSQAIRTVNASIVES